MLKQIMTLLRNWRQAKSTFSTLAHLYALGDHRLDALGGLTREEMDGLARWAQDVPAGGTIVEVGTLFGLTTIELARRAPEGVKVVTVDNFCWNPFGLPPAHHAGFTRRILAPWIEMGKVELVQADSEAFRKNLGSVPSMVFFDADHSYEVVRDEIAWAKPLGVKIICGHDYANAHFGVTRAVDEAFPQGVETAGMWWKAKIVGL